jgi:hypothetical protein
MADGTIAVLESSDPSAKLIDNDVLTVDGETVYRQRVASPDLEAMRQSLNDIAWHAILNEMESPSWLK